MATDVQGLIDQLTTRCFGVSDSGKRTVCLREIDRAEKWISQQGSFLYLRKRTTLTITSSASSAAAPADFDYGKAASLYGTNGPLEYKPAGEFDAVGSVSGGNRILNTEPSFWTFAFEAGTTGTIYVKPANTTGGSLSLTFEYQKFVAALEDTTNSFSLLPEGYELTLLLDRAEYYVRRLLNLPMRPDFVAEMSAQLQAFYNAQRATKPEARTDVETEADAMYERELKPR